MELIHIFILRQNAARLIDSLKGVGNGSPLLLVIDQLVSSFHGVCESSVMIRATRSILARLRHRTVVHLKVELVVTDLQVPGKFLLFLLGGLDQTLNVVGFVHVDEAELLEVYVLGIVVVQQIVDLSVIF